MGGLIFRCAATDLDEAIALEHARLADVSESLGRARMTVEKHESVRQEMAHDARNALAGLRAALTTLDKYDGQLDDTSSAPLRRAAIEELAHLEHLLTHTHEQQPQPFDAGEVVRQTVETHRTLGAEITARIQATVAHGRPHDLTTALQNLLINAGVHAPGSPVEVDVTTEGDRVKISVSDRGPGLSEPEARRVFQRGVRSKTSPGSGLGLHNALSLMRAQGGDLELVHLPRGLRFELTLPAGQGLEAGIACACASR